MRRSLYISYFTITSVVFFIFSGLSFAGSSEFKKQNKTEIHIGIYAPFSNEQAFIGRNMLGTIEKARDQLKFSEINYSFYTLDQLPDNSQAANTLEKFIKAHHIKILLTKGSSDGILAAAIAKKNNIIHFSMANDLTIADGKNNFLAWSPAYDQAVAVVDQLKRKKMDDSATMMTNPHSSAVFSHSIIKRMHENSPIFNVFSLLNQGAVLAMKTNPECSSQQISEQIIALAASKNMIGSFNLNKQGVLYSIAEENLPKKDSITA